VVAARGPMGDDGRRVSIAEETRELAIAPVRELLLSRIRYRRPEDGAALAAFAAA
jgi:hypothetical protein